MNSNPKDESPFPPAETDQKLTKPEETVGADSEPSEQKLETQTRPVGRPDLDWTDHED